MSILVRGTRFYESQNTPILVPKQTLVGAGIGGNADPVDLESRVGPTTAHRMYWNADQVAAAITWLQRDLAAGRAPFISFKFPTSWAAMATGAGDAWYSNLLDQVTIAANGKTVFLCLHHEPEGDEAGGGVEGLDTLVATWQRLYAMPRAANIRFTLCFTSWNWTSSRNPSASSLSARFPGAVPADVITFDAYNYYGAYSSVAEFQAQSGTKNYNWVELEEYMSVLRTFAEAKGIGWGMAEFGYTHEAAVHDVYWLDRAIQYAIDHNAEVMTYFCSNLNSRGDWDFRGDAIREAAFARALAASKL